jgi:methylated-DNA-protein-cysteine methyltransferase-like protein
MIHRHQANRGYQAVWEMVRQIPKGRVATYGDIARLSSLVGQARQVGYALHALPSNSNVPWHRVINSQGKISLPKANAHYKVQKQLLEKEGVVFEDGRVDLKEFGWLQSLDSVLRRQANVTQSGKKGLRQRRKE